MRKLLSASLFVLLVVGGCAAQPPPGDDVEVQKAVWWFLPALVVGATVYSTETAKKEAKKARAFQRGERQAAEAQYREMTEKQMRMRMGQQRLDIITDLFFRQDQAETRILTLPSSREPPGIIDRINLWIDRALRA